MTILPLSMLRVGKGLSLKPLPIKLNARLRPVGIVTLKNRTQGPVAKLFINCAIEKRPQADKESALAQS